MPDCPLSKPNAMQAITGLLVLLLTAGCASTNTPDNVDLSGRWIFNEMATNETIPRRLKNRATQTEHNNVLTTDGTDLNLGEIDLRRDVTIEPENPSGKLESARTQSDPFGLFPVINANRITIQQSSSGVSFTYAAGMNRKVDWGEMKQGAFTSQTGWRNNDLVVETRNDRAVFTETYSLHSNGKTMTVTLKTKRGMNAARKVTRIFNRKPAKIQVQDLSTY